MRLLVCLLVLLAASGCGSSREPFSVAQAQTEVSNRAQKILILGDSLTEGYGITKDKAFPTLVEKKLRESGHSAVAVINAGVSGSTSASGPSRLRWHLKSGPAIVVVALGANDGLRGLPVPEMKKNLKTMIRMAKDAGAKVVLAGMKMPPNYGPQYTRDYENAFRTLATEEKVEFIPFLLEGVGGNPDLNLSDGIHPNERGHQKIANLVVGAIEKLL